MNIVVIKRDGTKEDYDSEKVDRVVVAAGLTPDQATSLVESVGEWLKEKSTHEVTSLEIRDKVLVELKKRDMYAANMFEWYQKTKENPSLS